MQQLRRWGDTLVGCMQRACRSSRELCLRRVRRWIAGCSGHGSSESSRQCDCSLLFAELVYFDDEYHAPRAWSITDRCRCAAMADHPCAGAAAGWQCQPHGHSGRFTAIGCTVRHSRCCLLLTVANGRWGFWLIAAPSKRHTTTNEDSRVAGTDCRDCRG
jgi:hypothetical protein